MNLRTAFVTLAYLLLLFVASSTPASTQSDQDTTEIAQIPISIRESDGAITVSWEISDQIETTDILEKLSAAGWNNNLLDDLTLPAFTFSAEEVSTQDNDPQGEKPPAADSSADRPNIEVVIDTHEEWSHPVEFQEMPDLVGPDGKVRPYIGPAEPIEELLPTEPVFILREGLLRGEMRYVVAVSPVYFDGESIQVATAGSATLTDFVVAEDLLTEDAPPENDLTDEAQSQRDQPSAAPPRPNNRQEQTPLTSPLVLPTTRASNIPLTTTLSLPNNSPSQVALTSPLALPTSAPQNVPLSTTLSLPTSVPGRAPQTSPLVLPTSRNQNVPLTQPLRLPGSQEQSEAATDPQPISPLATVTPTPGDVPLNVPLSSPLTLPTAIVVPAPTQAAEEQPDSAPTLADDAKEDAVEPTMLPAPTEQTETPDETASEIVEDSAGEDNGRAPDSNQVNTSTEAASTQAVSTPWTGLMTFAFFGVLLLAMLFTNRD